MLKEDFSLLSGLLGPMLLILGLEMNLRERRRWERASDEVYTVMMKTTPAVCAPSETSKGETCTSPTIVRPRTLGTHLVAMPPSAEEMLHFFFLTLKKDA